MRLNEAEPTPMYSSSSDETGTGEEDGEIDGMGMGLHRGGDDVLLSLHEAKDSDRHRIMDSTSPNFIQLNKPRCSLGIKIPVIKM